VNRSISRREALVGGGLGLIAAGLAACGTTRPSATASAPPSAGPYPTPSGSAIGPSVGPSVSASRAPTSSPSGLSDAELRRLIASLLIVGFRGQTAAGGDWIIRAIADGGLGGVILFDHDQLTGTRRNIASPSQLGSLVRTLRAAAGSAGLIVSIDQEGGQVARLNAGDGYAATLSEAQVGAHDDLAATHAWAHTMATWLAGARINLNFAPVVDLDVNPKSPAIGALDRSFSADPDVVVERATIEIEAHRAVDVRTTLKHFPGIGSSTTNTDFGVADVTKTWSRTELQPFQRLIVSGHADLVMAGHVVNGQLDATGRPASLSAPIVTDLLRGELAWSGVVVTDDLQAAAITKTFGRDEAILLALEAGNDLLLLANQQVYDPRIVTRVVEVVERAVGSGRLPATRIDEAFDRVRAAFP